MLMTFTKTEMKIRMRLGKRVSKFIPKNPVLRKIYRGIMMLDRKIL